MADWIPQMQLDLARAQAQDGGHASRWLGRTFRDTRTRPVHRWFGFVEGFSADYLVATLDELANATNSIYDPFGGAGTALVEASQRGVSSFYAEANPFMAFVIDAKVNASRWAAKHPVSARESLRFFRDSLLHPSFLSDARKDDVAYVHHAFPRRGFFDEDHLRCIVHALRLAGQLGDSAPESSQLALLACAANIVSSSHMTRRADLRRRKPGEYKTRVVDVPTSIASSVSDMLVDLDYVQDECAETLQVARDCRRLPAQYRDFFDLAITSPPYLNGTNYVRNTKLELVLLNFIQHETELGLLRDAGVCAGITQAASTRPVSHTIDVIAPVVERLDRCATDRRIPRLVRAYFSDMYEVMSAVHTSLKPNGLFIMDIGDSKFYGVHVPTDRLLLSIATSLGFSVEQDRVIARRHSRDKTPLVQVDLHLRKQ
jgi:hypothetical protein